MSGFKDKTWMKWKANKTTSPVAVTDKKSIESIRSQRSSSLIRSRKCRTTRDAVDDIGFFQLAAENRGKDIPRPLVECGENKPTTTDIDDRYDAEQKNDFRDKTTSPFNTLAPTNPFCRDNTMIVQYGELEDGKVKSPSDSGKTDELWGELPSTEVAASPKPHREKGPKGGSRHSTSAKKSRHKTSAPPASPTNEKSQHPATPQAHVHAQPAPQAPRHADSGPSVSHDPPPHSGQSQHHRTSPSSDPGHGMCDLPECPARGPKKKERLCMAPECPVTMKKAVVKEAKRAMKRSCGKKRKNPLSILGAVLMSAFAGNDSTCKLTKEEKKALKRMKAEDEGDDSCSTSGTKKQKSVGVQCKAPISKDNDRPQKGPSKADKSTSCDIPECPIAKQKTKIKEFMDKGQLCDIPGCPIKEPPPRVEPKGCPAKPCTLKTKDEEFLKSLGPSIYEKIPRLKMTCEEAHAGGNEGQSRPHHAQPAIKNKDRQPTDKTKEKDRGVKIVAAHVHVPQPSENPFQTTITNPQELSDFSEPKNRLPDENHVSLNKESEYQKLVNRRLSAPVFMSEAKTDEVKCTRAGAADLCRKEKCVIGSEDGTNSRRSPKIRFSNISVNHKDSSRKGTRETNKPIEYPADFLAKKSLMLKFKESVRRRIEPDDTVQAMSHQKTLLDGENVLKTSLSNLLSTSTNDPIMINATSKQASKDQTTKKCLDPITGIKKVRSKEIEMHPFDPIAAEQPGSANVEKAMQDFQASDSYSLIKNSASKMLKPDFPPKLEDEWRVVTVLPVKYPSAYSATSNHILKDPFDLRTPKETSDIKLLQRNSNTFENSKASLAGEINSSLSMCWCTNDKDKDILCDPVENITTPFENQLMKSFSSFKFSEKINEPLIVDRNQFDNTFDDNRFEEMSLTIFVAEPAIATDLPKKSKPGSDRDQRLSETMTKAKNVARLLDELNEAQCNFDIAEPSKRIKFKKPILSLRMCQDTEDIRTLEQKYILGKETSRCVEQGGRTDENFLIEKSACSVTSTKTNTASRVSTARRNRLDNSVVSNETCTQTLTTSAVSPNELNSIGVGNISMMGSGYQHSLPR